MEAITISLNTVKHLGANYLRVKFDTDSFVIAVDSATTYCMTPYKSDLDPKSIRRINQLVRGAHGTERATLSGTGTWGFESDQGVNYKIPITNMIYSPNLPFRIASPQHIAQVLKAMSPRNKFVCVIDDKQVMLHWIIDGTPSIKTIPLDSDNNLPMFRSSPGFKNYAMFAQQTRQAQLDNDLIALDAHVIPPDDDDESTNTNQTLQSNILRPPEARQPSFPSATTIPAEPNRIEFYDEEIPVITNSPDHEEIGKPQLLLLKWHYKLGHLAFPRLQAMAREGILPNQLATCPIPTCTCCIYGKQTRRPWRTKATPGTIETKATITKPGQCISVDQLVSPAPGLIAQLRGIPTTERYRCATVFVDHFSRYSFVHLQKSASADHTLEAKAEFERVAATHGVIVSHYHADNGIFADNKFMADIAKSSQSISFCGAYAHFQNGIAEKRIRDLQESARTQLIHAKMRWPQAISIALWPYALRAANDVYNATVHRGQSQSPIELFSSSNVRPKLDQFHPFGCPTYVLNQQPTKWDLRSILGINLGHSLRHASTVVNVLNPNTGLVSPQFHVKFDDTFETVIGTNNNTHGQWMTKCRFKRERSIAGIFKAPLKAVQKALATAPELLTDVTTTSHAELPSDETNNNLMDDDNEEPPEPEPPPVPEPNDNMNQPQLRRST